MEILTLGEKIKQKRKEQNMTLKDLAGDKVTPGQISLVESGKTKPSIDLLEYIAEKMNISLDYILETEEHQAEKLCEYYSKVASASLYSESYEQAREAISKGMIYAKDYNLEYFVGLNELYLGKIEFGQGNYKSSQNRFLMADEVFLRIGKMRDAVEVYLQLGLTMYKLESYDSSLNFFKHGERMIHENSINDDDVLIKIYYNISLCYSKLGNYSSTIDYTLLAMEKLKKKNDRFQYGQSLLALSLTCKNMSKYNEALEYADKAVRIFKELENLSYISRVETSIGAILCDIGNTEESLKHLENAYRIKMEIKDLTLIDTMMGLADNYIASRDIDKAMDMAARANEICIEEGAGQYYVRIRSLLHKLHIMKQDKLNAELCLLEAVKHLKSMNMMKELADVYILLGEFYKNEGSREEALKAYNLGIGIYKEVGMIPAV